MTKKRERTIELMKNAQEEFASEYELIIVPEIMSKKVVAYGAMRYDLELILQYLELLKQKNDDIYASALTYSIIALYGKCFTDATEGKYPKLEPNSIFEDRPDLRKQHDYFMDLRHKFIAHRGKTDDEIGISYIAVSKNEPNKAKLKYRQLKLSGFAKDKLEKFEELFTFVFETLNKKFAKAGNKVYDGMLNTFSKEDLNNFTFTNLKK